MTNTLHRYGSAGSLRDDFIVFAMPTRVNAEGSVPKLQAFLRAAVKYDPVNLGNARRGGFHRPSEHLTPIAHWRRSDGITPDEVIGGVDAPTVVYAVFDDAGKMERFLADVRALDLGMSVNVSAVTEEARQAAARAGITRHSVEYSLGFCLGRLDRLPERRTLELSTMCGHGMVSSGLAQKMVQMVKEGRRTPEEASRCLARFCSCGIYNPARAARLLREATEGRTTRWNA
jgi:hypothetical protein